MVCRSGSRKAEAGRWERSGGTTDRRQERCTVASPQDRRRAGSPRTTPENRSRAATTRSGPIAPPASRSVGSRIAGTSTMDARQMPITNDAVPAVASIPVPPRRLARSPMGRKSRPRPETAESAFPSDAMAGRSTNQPRSIRMAPTVSSAPPIMRQGAKGPYPAGQSRRLPTGCSNTAALLCHVLPPLLPSSPALPSRQSRRRSRDRSFCLPHDARSRRTRREVV